jgi:3-hydroxyisobutyrate dehydrogenase-like beta-hydroxyacid dehydrogenase
MRVGFIGLGAIGAPMARRLLRPEFELTVHDNHGAALEPFARTAAHCTTSCTDLTRSSQVIAVCVRDDVQLLAVAYGNDSLSDSVTPGTTVIVHSTVRPQTVRDLAETLALRGAWVLDAAVTGGPQLAATGELCAMVGGDPADLERVRPVLEACCSRIVHAGGLGAGMALKAATDLATILQLLAAHEADRLARAAGLDPALLATAMTETGNLSAPMRRFLEVRATGPASPGEQAYGELLECMGELGARDLEIALEVSREAGVELPAAAAAHVLFSTR